MIFDVVPWKRSNSKQVVKSAGISAGQCLPKSQEQHSHENTALDAGKLAFQEGADTVSSAGIGTCDFWSLLHQDELRYPHDTHHKYKWLCNASPHSPHETVIFISFWQKKLSLLLLEGLSPLPIGQNSWPGLLRAYRGLGRQPCPQVTVGVLPFAIQGRL